MKTKLFDCDWCGTGNDQHPPDHTMDCNRPGRCFACGKALKTIDFIVDTRDDQLVYVGPECFKRIKKSGDKGYQPPLGGPRLWLRKVV